MGMLGKAHSVLHHHISLLHLVGNRSLEIENLLQHLMVNFSFEKAKGYCVCCFAIIGITWIHNLVIPNHM